MKARCIVACAFLALIWHHIWLDLREAIDFIRSVYSGTVIGPDHSPLLLHMDKQQGRGPETPRPVESWSVVSSSSIFVW